MWVKLPLFRDGCKRSGPALRLALEPCERGRCLTLDEMDDKEMVSFRMNLFVCNFC